MDGALIPLALLPHSLALHLQLAHRHLHRYFPKGTRRPQINIICPTSFSLIKYWTPIFQLKTLIGLG